MTLQMKCIIPLLDETFTEDLFTEEAGFLNAFNADINRPYLDNHIFLLYDANLGIPENHKRNERLMSSNNLYQRFFIRINGILLILYVFCIVNPAIKRIIKGKLLMSDIDKMRVMNFWKFDIKLCTAVLQNKCFDVLNTVVPEQDYNPSLDGKGWPNLEC